MQNRSSYLFKGRGVGTGTPDDPCHIIECKAGTVLAIIITFGGVDFLRGYCRRAMIDRWGVYCVDPFRRANNASLTQSWAVPEPKGIGLFRRTSLEIISEREWMRRSAFDVEADHAPHERDYDDMD